MAFQLPTLNKASTISDGFKPTITYSVEKVFSKGFYLYDKYSVQGEGLLVIEVPAGQDDFQGSTDAYKKVLDQFKDTLKDSTCIITNVSVGSNKGYGLIPYVINCECYDFTGGSEGFIDLKSEINTSYSPQDNSLQVSRTIEGKGIASQYDNIDSVFSIIKATVDGLSNQSFSVSTIKGGPTINSQQIALVSRKTIEDPVNASYSVVEQYSAIKDGEKFTKPVVKVSVSKQMNLETNSTITVSVQGIYREIKNKNIDNSIKDIKEMKKIMDKYYTPESEFKPIDFSYKDDPFTSTADIQITYSNDQRIDQDGFLQEQSISFSVDYTSASSELSYSSSVRPYLNNKGGKDPKDNSSEAVTKLNIEKKDFKLNSISNTNKKDKDYLSKNKIFTKKWNKAFNMIGGDFTKGPDAYNVNMTVSVDFGTAQASYTPILEGRGAYYVEDLDFATRDKINGKISASIPKDASPPTSKLVEKLKQTVKSLGTAGDFIVLKDNIDTQVYYGSEKKDVSEISIEYEVSAKESDKISKIRPSQ